mgnify:FL=1
MHDIDELPILVLAYNRFDKFKKCINTLYSQGVRKIFISIDGPKNSLDIKEQKKIERFCKKNMFEIDFKLNFLQYNNGCRLGPIKGISWFFQQNKYGVVLEDDVIISNKCLETFCFLLQKNIYKKNYMSLSSFNEYAINENEQLYSMPVWRSWGWATWAEKWIEHINFSEKINNFNFWKLYNLLPLELRSIETINLLKASQLNLLDAWDYEFNFSHIANNLKSLTIGGINNYVYGFDDSATHPINLESLDIDFNLFNKTQIDKSIIKICNYEESNKIMKKCGFFYDHKKYKKNFNFSDLFLGTIFRLIFFLRIIKRIIFRIL